MTIFKNPWFYVVLAGILAIVIAFRSCEKEPAIPNPYSSPKEKQRTESVSVERLKSAKDKRYTDSLLAEIKVGNERSAKLRSENAYLKRKAGNSVATYHKTPTLANCDSAISDMENHSAKLETALAECDTISRRKDLVIWSQTGTITRKDSVIAFQTNGWQAANLDNDKLQKKLRNRNKALKIGSGIIALLVGVVAVK